MSTNSILSKIRAEIERRRDICKAIFERESDTYYQGKAVAYDETLSFLDTLSVEPDKSLEEAAEEWCKENGRGFVLRDKSAYYIGETLPAFKAGAEWQKEQDLAEMAQSKSPLSVAYANRCFENGKQAMKQQMLKDAIEGEVVVPIYEGDDTWSAEIKIPGGYEIGDKVRIVVLKEEEQI